MMGYNWGMGWGWLFGVLLLIGLVVVAVRVLGGGTSRSAGRQPTPPGAGSARQVLDDRYARGELSTEEYRERLRVLDEGS